MLRVLKIGLILLLLLLTPIAIVGLVLGGMSVGIAAGHPDGKAGQFDFASEEGGDPWPQEACEMAASFIATYVELRRHTDTLVREEISDSLDRVSSITRRMAVDDLMMLAAGMKVDAAEVAAQSGDDCPDVLAAIR